VRGYEKFVRGIGADENFTWVTCDLPYLQAMKKEITMNFNMSIGPLISLIAGILILVMPKLLNYIVAIYLIAIGILGLVGTGSLHLR
jgi:Protein of unknown function (DUF3096)